MGAVLAIVVFGICFLYPPISILKSHDVGLNKPKWAAIAFFSPFGLLLIPAIAHRLATSSITSADIAFGWVGTMTSIANILALLIPWAVLFAYEKKHKVASETPQINTEPQALE